MYKLKIFSIGKTKESWLKAAIEEYSRRLAPILSIEWILLRNPLQLIQATSKEDKYAVLDPLGNQLTSEDFSQWLISTLGSNASRLSLVIGGAEGIPPEISQGAFAKIGLSRLTFTHQLTRLILVEQCYRAFEIEKGGNYHK